MKRGLIGEVISRIEKKGWTVVEAKSRKLEPAFLYEFYEHIKDRPFFLETFDYMLSGTVIGFIIEGEGIIAGMRRLIGSAIIEQAHPGTIRGDYAVSTSNSLIHASKTPDQVNKEINIFFNG